MAEISEQVGLYHLHIYKPCFPWPATAACVQHQYIQVLEPGTK